MEGPLEQVLEHSKSPNVIDATTSGLTYNSLAALNYLWYPHTTEFGMPSLPLWPPPLTWPLSSYILTAVSGR